MGSLENRLARLEARIETTREDDKAIMGREVMKRLTDQELRAYEGALRRALAAGAFAEEDRTILDRVEGLYEDVSREFAGA